MSGGKEVWKVRICGLQGRWCGGEGAVGEATAPGWSSIELGMRLGDLVWKELSVVLISAVTAP